MPEINFDDAMMAEFSDEFSEKLTQLNHLLIETERAGEAQSRITDLFRAAHSLKGLSALAGLQAASSITHHLESVFEAVRGGSIVYSAQVSEAGFAACDHLQRLLEDFTSGAEDETDIASCLSLLQSTAAGQKAQASQDAALVHSTPQEEEKPSEDAHNRASRDLEMLRVDPARLDVVLNLSSELMIVKARLADQYRKLNTVGSHLEASIAHASGTSDSQINSIRELITTIEGLDTTVRTVHRLASTLQTQALRLRMVPVGPLFRRFERVLRDACRSTGHEARLVILGESTELDKKLIDQLIDPITHLLRNAVDHGLESPDERVASGKSRRGTVTLEAAQEAGRVVIRVSDDGKGIDPARLRKAIALKSLLPEAQADKLTDREAIAFIFQSGFSTARAVTDISGRGVGLDIVRSRISALSGSVEVETEIAAGTTFVVTLPLTLAMVRSLLVESGGARYALPLHAIKEVVQVESSAIHDIGGSPSHLEVKRELIPLVAIGQPMARTHEQRWAVLARTEHAMIAIIVDRVLREEELVVKPIPSYLRGVNGSSGATILGDGSIALFLDIAPLLERHQQGVVAAPVPA